MQSSLTYNWSRAHINYMYSALWFLYWCWLTYAEHWASDVQCHVRHDTDCANEARVAGYGTHPVGYMKCINFDVDHLPAGSQGAKYLLPQKTFRTLWICMENSWRKCSWNYKFCSCSVLHCCCHLLLPQASQQYMSSSVTACDHTAHFYMPRQ